MNPLLSHARNATLLLLGGISAWLAAPEPVWAQPFRQPAPGISEKVTIPQAQAVRRSQLQRLLQLADKGNWDEALPLVLELLDEQPQELVELTSAALGSQPTVRRWVPLGYYVQWFLSQQEPEVLQRYRRQVDPVAEHLLAQAVRQHSLRQLEELLERYFCSTPAEEALLLLGEWYLEQGRYDLARWTWSRLLPLEPDHRVPASVFQQVAARARETSAEEYERLRRWYQPGTGENWPFFYLQASFARGDHLVQVARFWKRHRVLADPSYPDPRTPPADVLARLVLVELYAGRVEQARAALRRLQRLYPEAEGTLGGVRGRWSELLARWLERGTWPSFSLGQKQWPTFAGNQRRCARAVGHVPRWRLKWSATGLPVGPLPDPELTRHYGLRLPPVAEPTGAPLVFHPAVSQGRLFVASIDHLLAWQLDTGQPAWGNPAPRGTPAAIALGDQSRRRLRPRFIGTPRYTVNVVGTRLLLRMGWPSTARVQVFDQRLHNFIVCLDLKAQGRELWRVTQRQLVQQREAETENALSWSFDGTPVSDGQHVFVALRRRGVQHQAHLACLDAETGTLRWRRFIVQADTPAHGRVDQCTHNLLTLHDGVVYFNTHLGAVAAVDADRGTIRWLVTYRKKLDPGTQALFQGAAHWHRSLTPCLYHQGRIVVAAADRPELFALDAASGHLQWMTASDQPQDVVHLLGVYQGRLLASGDRLWWIDADSGKLLRVWPQQGSGIGLGRGTLVDGYVYFPVRGRDQGLIFVFDAASGRQTGPPIRLPAASGNLVVAQGYLIVAGFNSLWVYEPAGKAPERPGTPPGSESPAKDVSSLLPESPPDD